MTSRCQVCGRVKPLNAQGLIGAHYRHGDLCRGAYAKPYAEASDAISTALNHYTQVDRRLSSQLLAHSDQRRNAPLEGSFWIAWKFVSGERLRLARRLQNWTRTVGSIAA